MLFGQGYIWSLTNKNKQFHWLVKLFLLWGWVKGMLDPRSWIQDVERSKIPLIRAWIQDAVLGKCSLINRGRGLVRATQVLLSLRSFVGKLAQREASCYNQVRCVELYLAIWLSAEDRVLLFNWSINHLYYPFFVDCGLCFFQGFFPPPGLGLFEGRG